MNRWQKFFSALDVAPGTHTTSGNSVEVLVDSEQFIPPMVEAIDSASEIICFQFYGMEADSGGRPFADALIRARSRGVDVRVILDFVEIFLQTNGKWSFLPFFRSREISAERKATRSMFREMEEAGIRFFKYGWNYGIRRNHSKSLIVDDRIVFVGGFNPTAHNAEWHDVCAALRGPAVLESRKKFDQTFSGNASQTTASKSESASEGECTVAWVSNEPQGGHFGVRRFFERAIDYSQNSVWIENGYLSDRRIIERLMKAKKDRLENVSLIVPEKSNHSSVDRKFRKQIPQLLKAGIDVFFYPRMTHAKLAVFDGELVTLGSANLDRFTLQTQNELNAVIWDPAGRVGEAVAREVFLKDFQVSRKLS